MDLKKKMQDPRPWAPTEVRKSKPNSDWEKHKECACSVQSSLTRYQMTHMIHAHVHEMDEVYL